MGEGVGAAALARPPSLGAGLAGVTGVTGSPVPLQRHRRAGSRGAGRARRHRPPAPAPGGPERAEAAARGEPQSRAQPWSLSQEQQQRWARGLARHSVAAARTLTRLFLVHSVPESLKFAFLFYLLTYVGAACNGVTLLAAGVISAFTFPVLYRRHQAQIDQYLSLARGHLSHLRARVLAKLPSAKVKPQ
ncbi:reticulon-2 [Camarhynchus parvulus]|uniref:reticulon-2 n=1 Tax=Geospiza parvula TaxID=87175 RepID=UPI001237CDED|nr:reticulon-2 [Camarhynchus parvulus]